MINTSAKALNSATCKSYRECVSLVPALLYRSDFSGIPAIDFDRDAIVSMPGYGLRYNNRNSAGISTVEDQLPLVLVFRDGQQVKHLRRGENTGMKADRHHVSAGDAQFHRGPQWAVRFSR